MTFEEQAAALRELETLAGRLRLSEGQFERIALAVTGEAREADGSTPERQLDEIRTRIEATRRHHLRPV